MESAYVYFYQMVASVKMSYIELESTWIHDCPGASNGMSIVTPQFWDIRGNANLSAKNI